MGKPRRVQVVVVPDEPHERVFGRVAAVDVAKKSGVACWRLPNAAGQQTARCKTVTATVSEVSALAAGLVSMGIEKVTLESTSDYWRIWFYLFEAAGLDVQLVNASQAKNLPGRPKTDRLDAQWLARLTEMGMLRPSFVPPAEVRALRLYARARTRLVQDRTRCWQRIEKVLEDALIKVSSVASKMTTLSVRDMLRALIDGERDPQVLAGLARSRMRAKHDALAEALEGRFEDHHAQVIEMLLDEIDFLDQKIKRTEMLISEQLASIPEAWGADADGVTGPGAGAGPDAPALNAAGRLDEIPGITAQLARSIISETGLDMTRFPTPDHLVSWAGLCPRAVQSGTRAKNGKKPGNTYLRGYLGQAAAGAAGTATFLGERHARIARRRGKAKAQVAVARSIAVIIWHLLSDRDARYAELGPDWHQNRTDKHRKTRGHVRQLEALGYTVTLTPAAA
ncbi:MAG TPA: IS110 family transposase [Streptosporangiaceae bacterium]|nr:IS110 family transposase [Streptosporangiaceae bacterium]